MIAKNKSKCMKPTYLFLTKQYQNIIIKIILLAKNLFFMLRWFINIDVYIYDQQQNSVQKQWYMSKIYFTNVLDTKTWIILVDN